jgi:hypothetical protein
MLYLQLSWKLFYPALTMNLFNNVVCMQLSVTLSKGPSWLWSYGTWIYNYICNQCLLPLMLWVCISIRARCTTLCDNVCQLLDESGVQRHQTNKQYFEWPIIVSIKTLFSWCLQINVYQFCVVSLVSLHNVPR